MDAARLLPLVGLFLFSLPALWRPEGGPGLATAREGLFLFVVWLGLIVAAALVASRLTRDLGPEEGEAVTDADAVPRRPEDGRAPGDGVRAGRAAPHPPLAAGEAADGGGG